MLFQEYYTLDEIEQQLDNGVYHDIRHLVFVLGTAIRTSHLDLSAALKLLAYYYQKDRKTPNKGELQKWASELKSATSS